MLPNLVLFLCLTCHVFAGSVAVNLRANWTDSPFEVQLVEAAAAYSDSLYYRTIKTLFVSASEDSDWEDEESDNDAESSNFVKTNDLESSFSNFYANLDLPDHSHHNLYAKVANEITNTELGFLNLNLVNSFQSPRIQAHYEHYNSDVKPDLEAKVLKQCTSDSFGEKIENPLAVWVKYGNKIYCSEQDLYALQLDKSSEAQLPFDRPIGTNMKAPTLTLYGDPTSESFSGMFSTLFSLAEAGNLRFVWRYIPCNSCPLLELSGYGKTLTVKTKKEGFQGKKEAISSLDDFFKFHEFDDVFDVSSDQISRLSHVITALILESDQPKQHLSKILKTLPQYAPHLAIAEAPSNFEQMSANAKSNEQKGASRDLMGISINGAMVHRLETDLSHMIDKLKDEVKFVEEMQALGFTIPQTKKLLTKFALMSAYKENEYRSGSTQNRFNVYKDIFDKNDKSSGGVVFFNDLSRDENYNLYSEDRHKVYVEEASRIRQGQIPPLKENVHDIIFVLNFSNKSQLKVFFAMSKMILDKGIPQQLGVLPIVENEKDSRIADMFYHILDVGELTEGLAFLYKYFDAKPEDEEKLFGLVTDSGKQAHLQYKNTLEKYSIVEPSVIINGVIVNMRSSNWQGKMGQQIIHDVKSLQNVIRQGTDQGQPLKSALYSGAKSSRNSRITPKDPGNIRYKRITPELVNASYSFRKEVNPEHPSITFWLIGDFNSNIILDQLKEILGFMRQYNGRSSQVRVINTAKESKTLEGLQEKYANKPLSSSMLREMVDLIGDFRVQTVSAPDPAKLQILEDNQIQSHQNTLLFNSRQFRLDSVFHIEELQQILQYEFPQRLDLIDQVIQTYPEEFAYQSITEFKPSRFDDLDWYDAVTSLLTASFNIEDSLVRTDVARFDFSSLNFENSISLTEHDGNKPLDILITIDPVDDFSQKLVSMAESLLDLSFVNVKLLLQPLTSTENPAPLRRFYASGFLKSRPNFNLEGTFERESTEQFDTISVTRFGSGIDVPNRWSVVKNDTVADLDLDDFGVSVETVTAEFTLKQLSVDAFVKNVKTGAGVPGLSIQAKSQQNTHQGFTMETMGYNQLRLEPGIWTVDIIKGHYELLSADANKYIANDNALVTSSLSVFSLSGNVIHVRVREAEKDKSTVPVVKKHANNNVFSIASGLSYEKLMAIMMLSVKAHTSQTVKFWLLEDFLSSQFRAQLPIFAAAYNFEYELISYKWPVWLRQQTEKHRVVWAYKILFLDVLFPADLDRVIFVDADQVARTDLVDLMRLDLQGAPYGFAPMCDSREDMEGFRFWKQGYWQNVLKDDLKYHISALFVVDLEVFRRDAVGDQLRTHYQKLSSDPNSLSNLDQDLPNNLQRKVPIFSLPQDWLWCETWCSAASKKTAKMIDLCSDPTSSESKLAKAKRSIPEWEAYNKQLKKIGNGQLEIVHDEL